MPEELENPKTPTADEIAELADRGEDISRFFTRKGKMMPPLAKLGTKIKNPWLKLPTTGNSFILEIDREDILLFNKELSVSEKVVIKSIPEPFIGNPETAKVVFLLLNPDHKGNELEDQKITTFRKAMFNNLHHISQEYPFYPLNPEFSKTESAKWWLPRIRELQRETGLDEATLSKSLLAIEWFPYHSKASALPTKRLCESQEYTFLLTKKMLEKSLVIRMRSKKRWLKVDERFGDVKSLKNPRCGYLTKRNMDGDLFEEIVKVLKRK